LYLHSLEIRSAYCTQVFLFYVILRAIVRIQGAFHKMNHAEQVDALYDELNNTLLRFDDEFDLKASDQVWVLHCLINDITNISLDFEVDINIEDD